MPAEMPGKGKKSRKDRGGPKQIGFRPPAEGELCCAVVRILGGKQMEVLRPDGQKMRCVIRAKFTGRRKRENRVTPGSWVLVGTREWEEGVGDLLCVYDNSDVMKLKKTMEPAAICTLAGADPLAAESGARSRGQDHVVFGEGEDDGAQRIDVAEAVSGDEDAFDGDEIDMDEI